MATPEKQIPVQRFHKTKEGHPYVPVEDGSHDMPPRDTAKTKLPPEEHFQSGEQIAEQTSPNNWYSELKE